MYFSIAASTSSASIGISALTFFGLYILLLATLPTFFILSTCSVLQLSIDSDLTFDTCVPSFLCSAAHRIHKKMPKFQLAHPGFFAAQSAQRSLPGTERSRSCSMRSLRACWRFDMVPAMVCSDTRHRVRPTEEAGATERVCRGLRRPLSDRRLGRAGRRDESKNRVLDTICSHQVVKTVNKNTQRSKRQCNAVALGKMNQSSTAA